MKKIILASGSPRRKQLLEWAEIPFEVIVRDTDESFPPGMEAVKAAELIAKNKALAVKELVSSDPHRLHMPVLGADTIVVLDGRIIGKPKDRNDGIAILKNLSGNTHQVITAVCILEGDKQSIFSDITEVDFHVLTEEQIIFYLDKYEPYDKAGAYAIQEWIGVIGIKAIRGDFYNVMGLPVSRVLMEEILREN